MGLTQQEYALKRQVRNDGAAQREASSLTTYLRTQASPAEKTAYLQATPPGSKAGTAPQTVAQLRAFMQTR